MIRAVWILTLLLILLVPSQALSQQAIAKVNRFAGEVFVRSQITPPVGEFRRVTAVPVSLFNGDEVRTERGRAEIVFPNDDAIRLLENSIARIAVAEEKRGLIGFRRKVLVRTISTSFGRLWFNVAAVRELETEIVSPAAVASIRGTTGEFRHHRSPDVSFAGVDEGRMFVEGAGGTRVELRDKEATIVFAGRSPSPPFAWAPGRPPGMREEDLGIETPLPTEPGTPTIPPITLVRAPSPTPGVGPSGGGSPPPFSANFTGTVTLSEVGPCFFSGTFTDNFSGTFAGTFAGFQPSSPLSGTFSGPSISGSFSGTIVGSFAGTWSGTTISGTRYSGTFSGKIIGSNFSATFTGRPVGQ